MTQRTNKGQQSGHADEAKHTERSLLFLTQLRRPLQPPSDYLFWCAYALLLSLFYIWDLELLPEKN